MQITNLVPTGGGSGDFVPITRTVNGQALSDDITLSKTDIGLSSVTNDAQLKIASNLSDLNNVATARTNLGLGDSATKNVGTTAGSIMAGDDSRVINAVPNTRTVNSKALSTDITLDKTDIGLGSVTNDAQLKRAANDFSTFTEKTTPVSTDIGLLEDAEASGAKKKFQLGNIAPMLGDNPSANGVTVTTPLPPQTLNDDDSFSVNVGQSVENGRVQAKLYKLVADGSGTTDIDIDFDSADESLYVQEDSAKTDFAGGVIQLHNNNPYTTILIHGDSDISDANGHTINAYNAASPSTSQKKFGIGSISFNGSNQYVELPSHADFALGSSDFTVEFWLYAASSSSERDILFRIGTDFDVELGITLGSTTATDWSGTGNVIGMHLNYDGSSWGLQVAGTTNVCDGVWHHIALVRQGTTHKLYIDGNLELNQTYTFTYLQEKINIGGQSYGGGTRGFGGYMDEIRLSNGEARYTGTFTPPTQAFQLNDYPTAQGYYVYIGSTLELNLSNVNEIDSLTITATSPTNTSIKGVVSFDQGLTWQKWNGSAFVTVATAASTSEANIKSALSALDWTSNANTTAELATAHTNLNVSSYDSWKIALYLKTSDSGVTPSISQVSIAYTMGTIRYDLVTGFRAANADAIVTYNDDTITVQNKINDGQDHSYLMNLIYY